MSGRQIRRRSWRVNAAEALRDAQSWLSELAKLPEMDAIEWPVLPDLPREDTYLGKVLPDRWPLVEGLITDYQPRKGRRLQAWKVADNCAELCEISGSSAQRLVDILEEEKEHVDADEDLGLSEQLEKINKLADLQELLQNYAASCDDCAATIRALEFPKLRAPTR